MTKIGDLLDTSGFKVGEVHSTGSGGFLSGVVGLLLAGFFVWYVGVSVFGELLFFSLVLAGMALFMTYTTTQWVRRRGHRVSPRVLLLGFAYAVVLDAFFVAVYRVRHESDLLVALAWFVPAAVVLGVVQYTVFEQRAG